MKILNKINFKGITARWFLNVFLIVAVFVTVATVAFSIIFRSVYYERIESLANDYAYEFKVLEGSTRLNFKDSAIEIAGNFKYKTKLEVQVFDHNGEMAVSTTGFQFNEHEKLDYSKAIETRKAQTLKTETTDGESVLVCSTPLYDASGNFLGVYRWIVSLKAVNKMCNIFTLMSGLSGFAVLMIFGFSGIYFIKSIVNPITAVGNMARKIAMGDFESRIEIGKEDEIGQLGDSINYMASELQAAQNLKNDFISSVSHELRTPLTAIRGWGETAKMSVGTDDELVNRGLDVVLSEANRLAGLVEELLDFSRMETGRLQVVSAPLDVTRILSESADMYAELARQNGIDFICNANSDELEVLGDQDRLKQVFINIIDNAVKYTESGGQVLITQTIEEGCVRITVSDTGVGIPAQDIDRVKEKFYKANKTVRGSGIGLAVADEIIKQHSGLLFIESTEGAGTTVTIVLPLYEAPEEEKPYEGETIELNALSDNVSEETNEQM